MVKAYKEENDSELYYLVSESNEEANKFYQNLAPNQVFIAKDYKEAITILDNY